MSIISIRIPEDVKRKVKKYDLNISQELRAYLEKRIEELERKEALDQIMSMLEKIPEVDEGFAEKSVAEDRSIE